MILVTAVACDGGKGKRVGLGRVSTGGGGWGVGVGGFSENWRLRFWRFKGLHGI